MKFMPSSTLSEQIAAHLADRITRLEIRPGERIVETKIADELGVSQSPVREAFRILEKKKLVRLVPRHGTFVSDINEKFIRSMYDIFEELVGLATRKTVINAGKEDRENLAALVGEIEKHFMEKDVFRFNDSFFEWGLLCLKYADDPILEEIILDFVPSIRRIEYMSLLKRSIGDLEGILNTIRRTAGYIEEGKPAEAEQNNRRGIREEKEYAVRIFCESSF